MARVRFTPGTRYVFHGQEYRVRQALSSGQLLVDNQSSGEQATVALTDLSAAWAGGALQFEVCGSNVQRGTAHPLATAYTYADFQQLPARYRDEAWRRYRLLLPLLALPPHARTRSAVAAQAAALPAPPDDRPTGRRTRAALGQAVSRGSLERWLQAFVASGSDIRALVPALRTDQVGRTRLEADVEAIVGDMLAECAAHPAYRTAQDVFLLIVQRIAEQNRTRDPEDYLRIPAPATIYRRIGVVGAAGVLRRRVSREAARAERAIGNGPTLTHILERVEIDHTLLDVFLVDDEDRLPIGRPTLTTALDVYSGLPIGCAVGFEPPSYRSVMNCLLHAILPKADTCALYGTAHGWVAYGLPETLVVDHGREFVGRGLQDACGQLGILLKQTPVRAPWFKGSIERHFRTVNTGLIHTLPGATFAPKEARDTADATRQACLSLTAFWQILHVFLLDIYAQRWHDGVADRPAHRWAASLQTGTTPCLPTSAEDVRMLLLPGEERTLQRCGIEFETLVYQSPALASLRAQLSPTERTVLIKYDPGDLSALYVADPTQGQWLRVPAADRSYTAGLSLWKHRLIRATVLRQQKKVDIYALADAKRRIQEIVEREFRLTRATRTRKTAARFLEMGTGPAPSIAAPPTALPGDDTPPPSDVAAARDGAVETPTLAGFGGDFGLLQRWPVPSLSGDSS